MEGVVDDLFGASADHDLAGRHVEAVCPGKPGSDRLAQLGRAFNRGVLGRASIERALGGFPDVAGRIEVRLTCTEAHHVDALGAQFGRLRGYLHGHRWGNR